MKRTLNYALYAAVAVAAVYALPDAANAYFGPGAGVSAIGTVFALIGSVFLMIVGFVWYPIKRLLNKLRPAKDEPEGFERVNER